MVEENFKLGIEVELDDKSLDGIVQEIQKRITDSAQQPTSGGTRRSPVPGGAATVRNMAATAGIDANAFGKEVAQALSRENNNLVKNLERTQGLIIQALDRLTRAMTTRERVATQGTARPGASQFAKAAETGPPGSNRELKKSAANRNENVGRINLTTNVNPSTGTSGAPKVDDLSGSARRAARLERQTIARGAAEKVSRFTTGPKEAAHPTARAAEMRADNVANSLDRLINELKKGALGKMPDLIRRLGIPTEVGRGMGASTQLRRAGSTEGGVVPGVIKMVGMQIKSITNSVSRDISALLGSDDFKQTLKSAEHTARRDPDRALGMIRRELRDLFKLSSVVPGGASREYAAGGEAQVEISFKGQDKLIAELEQYGNDEAAILSHLSAKLNALVKESPGAFRKHGMSQMAMTGLTEESAAKSELFRDKRGRVTGASLNVQTRNLATLNPAGERGMRAMRSRQPMEALQTVGGTVPQIQSPAMKGLIDAGEVVSQMANRLKVAYTSEQITPELQEDQAIVSQKVLDSGMLDTWKRSQTQHMDVVAPEIQKGQELVQGQVIGQDVTGKPIKFELHGQQAIVESIEESFEQGAETFRIVFKEHIKAQTGEKLTTRSGHKFTIRGGDPEAMGAPKGTQVMLSGHAPGKRNVIGDALEVASSSIASKLDPKKISMKAQEISELIMASMEETGDLFESAKMVASQLGVKGWTGGERVSQTKGGKALKESGIKTMMTGELDLFRLKSPREQGPADVSTKLLDTSAMSGLRGRAETEKMARDFQERMQRMGGSTDEYLTQLIALKDATKIATMGLETLDPTSFKRLGDVAAGPEDLQGTILDPKHAGAFAVNLPTRQGGTEAFRVPSTGKGLGQRDTFTTQAGYQAPDSMTRMFDNLIQTAGSLQISQGGEDDPRAMVASELGRNEAIHASTKAFNEQIKVLMQQASASKEGAAAAQQFIESWIPFINQLEQGGKLEVLQYKQGDKTREAFGPGQSRSNVEEYIRSQKTPAGGLSAVRDLMVGRTSLETKGTTNVPTAGAIATDLDSLVEVLERLKVPVKQDAEAIDFLWKKLDKLKNKIKEQFAVDMARKQTKPSDERKRGFLSRQDSGAGMAHKELTAIQFRTNISAPLEEAGAVLDQLAKSGADVAKAGAAFEQLSKIQDLETAIPENVVMLNKVDYDNLVKAIQGEQSKLGNKIGFKEASKLADQGLLHRFPTTGEQSFQPRRVITTQDDTLVPAGKIGVAGPAAGRASQFEALLAPLRELQGTLSEQIIAAGGSGEAAETLRKRLNSLSPLVDKLTKQYMLAATNLDFDGDKISLFASTSEDAAASLRKFISASEEGGKATPDRTMLSRLLGRQGDVSDTQNLKQYVDSLSKVRKGPGRGGRGLAPAGEETDKFEAQSLIGPKKSVGLMTDLFNKQHIAAFFQAGEGIESMANAVSILMLNINKSLSMKGGGKGVSGPMELLQDMQLLKRGAISKKMGGEGDNESYQELREIGKSVDSYRQTQLTGMNPAELRSFQKKQGITDQQLGGPIKDKMNAEEYKGLITNLINFSGIEQGFMKLIDKLEGEIVGRHAKKNKQTLEQSKFDFVAMRGAVESEPSQAKQRKIIKDSGFSIEGVLGDIAPGWMGTRKSSVKEAKRLGQAGGEGGFDDQITDILKIAAKNLASGVAMLEDPIETVRQDFAALAGGTEFKDAQKWGRAMAASIKNLQQKIKSSATIFTSGERPAGINEKTRGFFSKSKGVNISQENVMSPLEDARQAYIEISKGLPVAAERLKKAAQAVKQAGATMAHESVHAASTDVLPRSATAPGVGLQAQLKASPAGTSAIGKDQFKIFQAMKGHSKVGPLLNALKEQMTMQDTALQKVGGADYAALAPEEQQKEMLKGIKGSSAQMDFKGARVKVAEIYERLTKVVAEELLAYQTDPEAFASMMKGGGVSDEAVEAITKRFAQLNEQVADRMMQQGKEGEDILFSAGNKLARKVAATMYMGIEKGLNVPAQERAAAVENAGESAQYQSKNRLRKLEAVIRGTQESAGLRGMEHTEDGRLRIDPSAAAVREDLPEGIGAFKMLPEAIGKHIQRARAGEIAPEDVMRDEREMKASAFKLREKISVAEKGSPEGAANAEKAYRRVMLEYRTAIATNLANIARDAEEEVEKLRAGGAKSGAIRNAVVKAVGLENQLQEYIESTFDPSGRGKGRISAGIGISAKGELSEEGRAAGLRASQKQIDSVFKEVAGHGEEGTEWLKQWKPLLENVVLEIKRGGSVTDIWASTFEKLQESPEDFRHNLVRLREAFAKIASLTAGIGEGQFSNTAQDVRQLTKEMGVLEKSLEGVDTSTPQKLQAAFTGGGAKAQGVVAKGAGADIGQSVEAQYAQAIAAAKEYKKTLEELISSPAYKKSGAPKQFEPIRQDIVDPKTGKVIQKIEIAATRMGKSVKTSFRQVGSAAQGMGKQIAQALRRVVQWGFASGIVYGLIRAFRNAITVVTDVETKMASLKKVMDVTTTNFVQMQQVAVGFAKTYGVAIGEVLDGMVVYGQQGLKMNEITERTRATMLAVNTTTLSATDATEALTAAHKVFGNQVSGSEGFVDAWGAVAAKHAITAKDLADSVKRSGAAANTAGVKFNDFLGIVTAIGQVTRQSGKEIATSTKFMFRAMRRPTAQKELLGMGVASKDPTGDMRPAMDILADVASKWDDLSRAQQLSTAQAMAGIRHYNSFIVLMENFGDAQQASIDAANSQGFAVRKNAIAMQTFSKHMEVAKQSVNDLVLSMGNSLLPLASGTIGVFSSIIDTVSSMPAVFQKAAVAAMGMIVVLGRGGDFVLDTLQGLGGMDSFGGDTARQTTGAGKIKMLVSWSGEKAKAGIEGLKKGVGSLITGMTTLRITSLAVFLPWAAALTAAAAGAYFLTKALLSTKQSGAEVADNLEMQIGQAQDAALQYKNVARSVDILGASHAKYQKMLATTQDPEKLKRQLDSGSFRGAATELKKYEALRGKIGEQVATTTPGAITGIDEKTGDFIFKADDGFKQIASSAADAQSAIAGALSTKIIKAYVNELRNATTMWGKLKEMIGVEIGDADLLSNVRDEINSLGAAMENMSGFGLLAAQGEMNSKIQKELELRSKVAEVSLQIKNHLESIPTFTDMNFAQDFLNNKDLREGASTAVQGGAFGRDATTASVMLSTLGKSAGLGGVLKAGTAGSGALQMESLLRTGVQGKATGAAQDVGAGAIAILPKEVAKALLSARSGINAVTDEMIAASQVAFTAVDESTGEIFYLMADEMGKLGPVTGEALQAAMSVAGSKILTFDQSALKQASEKTKKLLSMQWQGVMAGIRDPGQVDFGLARKSDMSVQQRVVSAMPDEMKRLVQIQKEVTNAQKLYNEEIEGMDPEAMQKSASQMKEGSKNLQILEAETTQMILNIMKEGFNLSVMGHFKSAMEELNKTMEESVVKLRDIAEAESDRFAMMTQTSGAMAGMGEIADINFGARKKELSAQQQLQLSTPGLGKAMSTLSTVREQRQSGFETLRGIKEQKRMFEEMVADLDEAWGNLTDEDRKMREGLLKKGFDKESVELIAGVSAGAASTRDAIASGADRTVSELAGIHEQLISVEDAILMPEKERENRAKDMKEAVKASYSIEEVQKALGRGKGGDQRNVEFIKRMAGLEFSGEGGKRGFGKSSAVPTEVAALEEGSAGRKQWEKLRESLLEDLTNLGRSNARLSRIDVQDPSAQASVRRLGAVENQKNLNESISKTFRQMNLIQGLEGMQERIGGDIAGTAGMRPGKLSTSGAAAPDIDAKLKDQRTRIAGMRADAAKRFGLAEEGAIKGIRDSTDYLIRAEKDYSIAVATQEFGKALSSLVDDFKKAEALAYEKVDSDLEGPFARVGKAGFKTDFEQRREELKGKRGGIQTLESMRATRDEKAKIDFDEKEARIKQKQDIEVANLRTQQGQAEQVRSTIADALLSGQLEGTGMEGQARNYMDTLTSQLAESEQATSRGGKLSFKGVPALEELQKVATQIKEKAKEKAQAAMVKIQQEGYQPMLTEMQTQTAAFVQHADRHSAQLTEAQKHTQLLTQIAGGSGAGVGVVAPAAAAAIQSADISAVSTRLNDLGRGADILSTMAQAGITGPVSDYTPRQERTAKHKARFDADMQSRSDPNVHDRSPGADFVKEQTLPSYKKTEANEASDKAFQQRMLMKAMAGGAQTFAPTGRVPEGTDTVSFSDQNLASQVGKSNKNLVLNANNALNSGNRDTTLGAVTNTNEVGTGLPGTSPAGRTPEAGGNEALNTALTNLPTTLVQALQGGITLGDEATTAITGIGDDVATALLATTLNVAVTNIPTMLIDDSSLTSLSSLLNTSNVAGAGADTTTGFENRITALETFVGDETVDSRIDSVKVDFTALDTTVTDFQISINESQETLTRKVDEFTLKIPPLESGLQDLTTRLDKTDTTVAAKATKLDEIEGISRRADSKAENAHTIAQRKRDR